MELCREQKKERYEAVEATMDKGCVVRLVNLSEDCSREDLKVRSTRLPRSRDLTPS